MKTNYLNAKQQMAALTLGVACLFSIAWINPVEKKKAIRKIVKENRIQSNIISDNTPAVYLDTTKKHKIKIVTIDANGNKTEYNSVKDMPDSLRKDFYRDQVFQGNRIYRMNSDTAFKFRDSLFQTKIYREFSSPEAQLKWKKFGDDIAKEYSSPEAQAKWKKFGDDFAKEFNSPEAQAKWKKMGEDMAKKMNSPEFRAQLDGLKMRVKGLDARKMSALSRSNIDSLVKLRTFSYDSDGPVIFMQDKTSKKVRESEEYKKIKERFDKEVKELKEKLEKKEKKERSEKPERPEQ